MTLDETIAHVLKLDGETTLNVMDGDLEITRLLSGHYNQADADLIASYRTLCPKMARALLVAVEALREFVRWGDEHSMKMLAEIQKELEP